MTVPTVRGSATLILILKSVWIRRNGKVLPVIRPFLSMHLTMLFMLAGGCLKGGSRLEEGLIGHDSIIVVIRPEDNHQ